MKTELDDPWPLTPDDGSVRAFYAASRNFFTGALSPGIGKDLQRSRVLFGGRASATRITRCGYSQRSMDRCTWLMA